MLHPGALPCSTHRGASMLHPGAHPSSIKDLSHIPSKGGFMLYQGASPFSFQGGHPSSIPGHLPIPSQNTFKLDQRRRPDPVRGTSLQYPGSHICYHLYLLIPGTPPSPPVDDSLLSHIGPTPSSIQGSVPALRSLPDPHRGVSLLHPGFSSCSAVPS